MVALCMLFAYINIETQMYVLLHVHTLFCTKEDKYSEYREENHNQFLRDKEGK